MLFIQDAIQMLIFIEWVLKRLYKNNLFSFYLAGEQYKWLERDLSNVDRSVTPWLIATWHPPWYSSYKAHYREAECMRLEMEELLYSYGVDVVFNGHVSEQKFNLFLSMYLFIVPGSCCLLDRMQRKFRERKESRTCNCTPF